MVVQICEDQEQWDDEILARGGHPLQLWGWGAVKAAHNWNVERVFVIEDDKITAAAQLLIRPLPWPFKSLVYIPRGPVCAVQEREAVLNTLGAYAQHSFGAISLTIEPDWEETVVYDGWRRSDNTILIPRTLILDLTKSDEALLTDMTKKTRQYIRKSEGESITIRQVKSREELDSCLTIYKQTAARAGFSLHNDQYYYDIFGTFRDNAPVFAAFSGDEPIAFLWLAISESTAFELYGGMNDKGQLLRANYALKWRTIQTAKKWGIERYDFNGLLNDGVSTFKQGFAAHETQLAGTYDKPLSPLYPLWNKGLPIMKKVVQKIKNR